MRHKKKDRKLGRTKSHREATLAALVCGLVSEKRIKTTLAKAKETRSLAEKLVTVGRKGTLAARRQAIAVLHRKEVVAELFDRIVPGFEGRAGGYTRILRLGQRSSDGSEMALVEWVDTAVPDKKKKASTEPETV